MEQALTARVNSRDWGRGLALGHFTDEAEAHRGEAPHLGLHREVEFESRLLDYESPHSTSKTLTIAPGIRLVLDKEQLLQL